MLPRVLEFAGAAYRYGHSQIRHRYLLNLQTDPVPLFPDLRGFRAVPRERTVDWTLFFDRPSVTSAQRARKIDGKLVPAVIGMPVAVTGECEIEDHHALAVGDLQRGRHRLAGAIRNGGLKKHGYSSADVVMLPSIGRCRIDP
jgi:hypothetical protein